MVGVRGRCRRGRRTSSNAIPRLALSVLLDKDGLGCLSIVHGCAHNLTLSSEPRPSDVCMAAGDDNTTESSLIFGFLVAFLASFALSITGGIVWPRIRLILAERYGLFPIESPHNVIVPSAVPELWDVCVRGVVRGAKVSDCGWEHLRASTPSLLSRASTRNHRRKRRTAVGTPCQSRVRPPFRARWKLWMREEEAEVRSCAPPSYSTSLSRVLGPRRMAAFNVRTTDSLSRGREGGTLRKKSWLNWMAPAAPSLS